MESLCGSNRIWNSILSADLVLVLVLCCFGLSGKGSRNVGNFCMGVPTSKGYLPNYTRELFKIKQIIFGPVIVYKLEDLSGEDIDGTFYEQELSLDSTKEYKVEKIIRKKKIKGKEYALVKWLGYGNKFNSWEPIENIRKM